MTSNASKGPRILGTLRSENGVGAVRIEDRLDAQVDEVWCALTEPDRLARWYGEVEGDLRVGGEFRSRVFASGWEGTGRITVCDPPHRLATVSNEPDRPEHVHEVTLTADGDQTLIVYENLSVPPDLLWAYGVGEQIHVEDLGAYLAGRARDADEGRWGELEPAYRELAAPIA
ncbi:MAG TPA: SRPBCC family protein [Gaiellaceae bacterium]|nr:SRPBCC family protein [Gaiellaceae bacterium]